MPFLVFLLKETPALIITSSGNESATFFYVLSGFVLFCSIKYGQTTYYSYIIKRICRIYIPYIVAITVAILSQLLLSKYGIATLSDWFNRSWSVGYSNELSLQYISLIGNYNADSYNNVIWSLVHEMRISIIFPFVIVIFSRDKFEYSLLFICSLSITSVLLLYFFRQTLTLISLLLTIHYCVLFLFGSLTAKYKNNLIKSF
ncbi:acyltransferase family protein [Bacillus thuringiensis]|uniref:acyltransferase family protein n=1 Tax=Bacillus thuringiensis TaxID=1428 RepID=UPI00211AFEAC|nr:acyltransferase family protein [Bacillus thuringiensis]